MKEKMLFGFMVDDVALDGWSTPEHLDRLVEFYNRQKVAATFFAVPENEAGVPLGERGEYRDSLKKLLESGHEIGQHGIRHERFEIGIPPQMILELPHEGPARKFLAENRERLAEELTVPNIRRKLEYGRSLLESVPGISIRGFRAPALQVCDHLYQALGEAGYRYDASACLQETGWDYLNKRYDVAPREISKARFDALQKVPNVPVWPLTTDYTWFLTPEHYERSMKLARHDFRQCREAGIPFITVCHVSPVQEGRENCGLHFLAELLTWMREQAERDGFELQSATLSEITDKMRDGLWN